MEIRERLSEIHALMLTGSRTASADLFIEALGPIVGLLVKRYPRLSDEDRHDIAVDVIVDYAAAPERCDEAKGSLWTFLCTAALRDASDLVRKRRRQTALLENAADDVELWLSRAKHLRNDDDDRIDAGHILAKYGYKLVTNDIEAAILVLILSDERSTEAFAAAMNLSPEADDTARIVKKAKDRMLLRLKRLGDELDG